MIVVVMGVSGCGKTTVGQALAAALGWPFFDGDDFHPERNVARMAAGIALTGRRSPSPAIRRAVTRLTKSGALAGTSEATSSAAVTAPSVTWVRRASDVSIAAKLRATTASPRFA